jgi:predicted O-methyltransferase YrrM
MADKFRMLIWFLKHPRLYPQLIRLALKKLTPASSRRDHTRQLAQQWCEEIAVDSPAAIQQLTGQAPAAPFRTLFSDWMVKAEEVERTCPVVMGGPGDLDLLYGAAEHLKATRVIETGVAYGWSSLALLLSLRRREPSKLVSTDMPYAAANSEQYVGCVVPEELRSNWEILRYADRQGLPRALKLLNTIDLCHYDSDKSYDGRMWAYPLLWNALRPGGFFISDDIGDNLAFRDFSIRVAGQPLVVKNGGKYIGLMVKEKPK